MMGHLKNDAYFPKRCQICYSDLDGPRDMDMDSCVSKKAMMNPHRLVESFIQFFIA